MLIANVHRETEAPAILPDADLEYWAGIYLRLELLKEGVTFEQFLRATPQVRENAARRDAQLLAVRRRQQQRGVQGRVDAEAGLRYALAPRDHQVMRRAMTGFSARGNGERIEKLRHRRWPRRARGFVPQES